MISIETAVSGRVVLVLGVLELLVYVVVDVVDVVVVGVPPAAERSSSNVQRLGDRGHVVDAEHLRAVPRAMTFVAIVPGTRPSMSSPLILPMNALRDVPTTIGRPIATSSSSRPSSARLWSTRLAEPDARVEPDLVLRDARGDRVLQALGQERLDVVDDVVVVRVVLHRARLAEHVHEADVHAALGAPGPRARGRRAAR